MATNSLKLKAVLLALAAGGVAFALCFAALLGHGAAGSSIGNATIVAIVCGALCWAAAERMVADTAGAIDCAIDRLASAGAGDLTSPVPAVVLERVPRLGASMAAMLDQVEQTLATANRLAMFDPVTQLPNRTNFRRACEQLLRDVGEGDAAALLFIDLDRFKRVNDTLGHAVGDMLLAGVAQRLEEVASAAGAQADAFPPLVGRLAGDEFTVFIPGLGTRGAALALGEAIMAALDRPFALNGHQVEIGASVGVALSPAHGGSLHELMRAADAAMYHAKANGRHRVEMFTPALDAELTARAELEEELRGAVQRQEFALVFQPQIRATDGEVVAAEALLRWQHPQGTRMPASFIRRAEDTGLIVEIGDWVLDAVTAAVARWHRQGVTQRLAINISPRQLAHGAFFHRLHAAMQAADVPLSLLELEIAETMATRCSDNVIEGLRALRVNGASIVLDDFGIGSVTLSRIRSLPLDRIKLDRSIVEHVDTRADARAVAHAIIRLVHGMGCQAVAKGVENQAQADVLRVIGCDLIQGYAVAPPMTEDAFLALTRTTVPERLAG